MHRFASSEAEVVLCYFCGLICRDCGPGSECIIKTTWRVPQTAVVYFRRFYLHNSLFAHDPRVMLVACLLLAGKTDEEFVKPSSLLEHIHPSLTIQKLHEAEKILLEGLGFQLQVYHPHSCKDALLGDIKARFGGASCTNENIRDCLYNWSRESGIVMSKLQNTAVCLAYIPLSISVASLLETESHAAPLKANHGFSLSDHITACFGEVAGSKLLQDATDISAFITQQEPPPEVLKSHLKYLASTALWSSKTKKKSKDKKPKI